MMRDLFLNRVAPWFIIVAAGFAFLCMITKESRGEELNFAIVGPQPEACLVGPSVPKLDEGELSFQMLGEPREVEIASVTKPTVFAYKDFSFVCPACAKLQKNASKLPFRLEWKQAPDWVKSYPTLHWQGVDGEWYQYRWGTSENDYLRVAELYAGTMEPRPPKPAEPVFKQYSNPVYYQSYRGSSRWTWPGDLRKHLQNPPHNKTAAFIATKTDRELIAIHDSEHGATRTSSAPVRRYCPSGNCPN